MLDFPTSTQVMHIQFDSHLEDGSAVDVSNTRLSLSKRVESEVFGTSCPEEPYAAGYRGNCSHGKISAEEASEQAWSAMARTGSQRCRRLLTETFCAYKVVHSTTAKE